MIQDSDDEFEKIKDQLAYFDWNVVTYIEDTDSLIAGDLKYKACCLKQILSNFFARDRWSFPATRAHFLDINQGGKGYIDSKLEFLGNFSRGWFLFSNPLLDHQLELRKAPDLRAIFDYYMSHHQEGLSVVDTQDAVKPVIDKAKSLFVEYTSGAPEEMSPILRRLATVIGDPSAGLESLRIQKELRKLNFNVNGKPIRYPDLDKQNLPQDRESLKSLVSRAIQESDFPFDSVETFFQMIDLTPPGALSEFYREILKLSALCDFLYLSPEKLKKETAFQSIMTDTEHLFLGLQCKWFVSEDQRLLIRAKFIQTWLGLNVKIFSIDSLVEYLLMQALIVHNDEHPGQEVHRVTFNFDDQNGNPIRKYEIRST